MKYERTASFLRDISRLPPEHYVMFRDAVYKHLLPAIEQGAHTGQASWPVRLRVHKLTGTDVYSLTWNFSSPDGRATFRFVATDDGEPVLQWRRVGDHSVYDRP
ncbi:hypothetical protein [Planomonospora sp. ID82291]|uniref:hypothetical protein n=1 Tax=Planomonospora sp. ID82291 TaxID=2738136 RepID=UPI0018C41334|nr:hypothetical protein [Planomonospora sp. ID82291]MBG0816940.1 hypothetical protein [Planomonospora sp. ID82291]